MSQHINLKELERKAWRSFYQDGIWDMTLGLILLSFAVSAFVDTLGVSDGIRITTYLTIEFIALAWMIIARKYITAPRLGQVRFKGRRKRRLGAIFVLGLSVFVGLVAWFLTARQQGFQLNAQTVPLLWMVNCLIVFGVLAYLLEFDRMYFIGALFALAVPFDQYVLTRLSDQNLGYIAFGLPALIVLTMGTIIFVRFLRSYPPVTTGLDDD